MSVFVMVFLLSCLFILLVVVSFPFLFLSFLLSFFVLLHPDFNVCPLGFSPRPSSRLDLDLDAFERFPFPSCPPQKAPTSQLARSAIA